MLLEQKIKPKFVPHIVSPTLIRSHSCPDGEGSFCCSGTPRT